MKKLLSLAVMAIGLAEAQAQDVKIEFITPSIVHVVKGQPTKTLVVTAKPQDVAVTKKGNTTSSKELTVKQDAKGNLTFLTAKGKVLLKEKECDVLEARQTFTLDKDEAIYGLGTIQNGKMNRRGEKKRMEQSNLEDFQNVLQSIKGYGIYWENYSPTLFEDNASGMTLRGQCQRHDLRRRGWRWRGLLFHVWQECRRRHCPDALPLRRRPHVPHVDLRLLAVQGAL